MAYTHVHFGAGKFGLGMVVDICSRAGFDSVVLNRASTGSSHHEALRRNSSYWISFDGDSEKAQLRSPAFYYFEHESDEHALGLLAAPSVVLVTTSVRPDGLRAVAPLIARALDLRRQQGCGPICVLACENLRLNSMELRQYVEAQSADESFKSYVNSYVVFCNTIVDRVCGDIVFRDDFAEVPAESHFEWIIEGPDADIEAIRRLSELDGVTVVRNRTVFDCFETRKYWCLNGLHLASAAFAYCTDRHCVLLSKALENQNVLEKVRALQDELGYAFRLYAERMGVMAFFPEEEVKRYGRTVLTRFQNNTKDRVARLLKHEDQAESKVRDFISSLIDLEIKDVLDLINSIQAGVQSVGQDKEELEKELRRILRAELTSILRRKLQNTLRLL